MPRGHYGARAQVSLVEASLLEQIFSLDYVNQSTSKYVCIYIYITKLFYHPFSVLLPFDGTISYLLDHLIRLSLMEGILYCCILIWLPLLLLSCCCCRLSSCFHNIIATLLRPWNLLSSSSMVGDSVSSG